MKATEDRVPLIRGQLTLYRRQSANGNGVLAVWQLRIKLPRRPEFPDDPKDIRKSTGFRDRRDAEQYAFRQYDAARNRWQNNQPLEPKKLAAVYAEYLEKQKTLEGYGEATPEKINKIEAAYDNHFKPFFGDCYITDLDEEAIERYISDRMQNQGLHGAAVRAVGTRPSPDTVNRENGVLRGIFELAYRKRYIVQEPKIRFLERKNDKRDHFAADEWEFIVRTLGEEAEAFRKQLGALPVARDAYKYRLMLKALVQLIGYSGVRAGRESNQNLRWRDIRVVTRQDENWASHPVALEKDGYGGAPVHHLEIAVRYVKWNTKPDPRTAIGIAPLESPLRRWRQETDFPSEDDYVFAHQRTGRNLPKEGEPGSPIQSLKRQFNEFLKRHGLLVDGNGKNRTLTSCRHTYATQRLIHSDMDIYHLARCMGTSIKMIEKIYGHVLPTDIKEKAAKIPASLRDVQFTE